MKQELECFTIFLVFMIFFASILTLSNSYSSAENINTKTVYYTTDGSSVSVTQPNLFVKIWMPRMLGHSGGEITQIMYKESDNIVNGDPQFGQLTLFNPETKTIMNLHIGSTSLVSESGNNTGQLTLVFASPEVHSESGQTLPINTSIKYVFYADIDDIFVSVEFNSIQKTWLFASSTYGASLNFSPFQTYNLTGFQYHNYASGPLNQKDQILYGNNPRYNILTLRNVTSNLAVTLFPTSLFLNLGTLGDFVASSKISLAHSRVRTWDSNWVDYGSYFTGGIAYSCVWAFSSDGNPFVVTPWIMPNSTPYGVYWTLDDLPASRGFYYIPPNPSAKEMNFLKAWLDSGTGTARRVTVLWSYDQIAAGNYARKPEGIDQSWAVHGTLRVDNMSSESINYYASIYGQQVGYGSHSYHHDYPWTWEFGGVTNVSWINATWNQIYMDAQAFLGNTTLNTFKAPGFQINPVGLNVITKYGIQQYETAVDRRLVPLYFGFKDDAGNRLIGTIDLSSAPDDVNNGKSAMDAANDLIEKISSFGLCSISGHFLSNNDTWATFNSASEQVESRFGDGLDYFLTKDLNDYWANVLWDNSYTFNTTGISSTSKDTRLTYKLLNRPLSFNIGNGLSCSVSDSAFHELYSPNFNTKGWKFTRVTGYSSISGIEDSGFSLTFGITKPLNTISSVKILMPQGRPVSVVGVDSYSYDSDTLILTLTAGKNVITSSVSINYQSAPPSSLPSESTSTSASSSPQYGTPTKAESSFPKLPLNNSSTSPVPALSPASPSLPNMSISNSSRNKSELLTPSLTKDSESSSPVSIPSFSDLPPAMAICITIVMISFVQLTLIKRSVNKKVKS